MKILDWIRITNFFDPFNTKRYLCSKYFNFVPIACQCMPANFGMGVHSLRRLCIIC